MPQGLTLEISHHPLTMKQVAHLIIALERLRDGQPILSTEFRDEDLLNIMLESVVEEKAVLETEARTRIELTEKASGFEKGQGTECSIIDCDKKHWVKMAMELQAVRLQAGNDNRKVRLNLTTYRAPPTGLAGTRPVTLAIKGTKLYLSCSNSSGKPILVLEEMKDDLTSIAAGSDKVRFLFYRKDTGADVTTLMSALHQGWYISTGVKEGNQDPQTVDMCELQTAQRCTSFSVLS